MKKMVSILLALLFVLSPIAAMAEDMTSDFQPILNRLLGYSAQDRSDMIYLLKGYIETDDGIDRLIRSVNNASETSTGLIDSYILDFLEYTDKETLIKYINKIKLADEEIRQTYLGYFVKADPSAPKDEITLSQQNQSYMQSVIDDLYSQYDGLETLFTEDGITVGVCARFLKILYDINDSKPLLTDLSSDQNKFALNIISDNLKSKENAVEYINQIITDFNNTNQNNMSGFKEVLKELGIYSPTIFYTVTFADGNATGTPPSSLSLAAGATFKLPANPFSKSGYTFNGWNDGIKNYQVGAQYIMPANDVTFTAQWTKNSSDSGGGGGGTVIVTPDPVIKVSYTVSTDEKYSTLGGTVLEVKQYKDNVLVDQAQLAKKNTLLVTQTYQNPIVYKVGADFTLTPVKYSYYEYGTLKFTVEETGTYLVKDSSNYFSDVTGWGSPYVESLYLRGIINGKGEKIFEPESNITREEFVKLIVSLFNLTNYNENVAFTDVNKNEWYYNYIMVGVTNGLINGIGNNEFGTGQNITRQDMCVIINKAISSFNVNMNSTTKNILDMAEIAEYAKESVSKMYHFGIVSGDQNGYFNPNNNATRQEASKVIFGVLKLIVSSYE